MIFNKNYLNRENFSGEITPIALCNSAWGNLRIAAWWKRTLKIKELSAPSTALSVQLSARVKQSNSKTPSGKSAWIFDCKVINYLNKNLWMWVSDSSATNDFIYELTSGNWLGLWCKVFFTSYFFQYGLYSAFAGCFMYIFFGSCKDITIGPTAIMALMTGKYVKLYGPAFSVLLTFLSGCIILLFGVLHLGESCWKFLP